MSVAGRWDESSVAGRRRTLSRADSGPSRGPTPLPAPAAAEPTAAASPAAAEPTVPSPAGAEPTPLAELSPSHLRSNASPPAGADAPFVSPPAAPLGHAASPTPAPPAETKPVPTPFRQSSKLVRSPTASSVASQPPSMPASARSYSTVGADYASMQLGSARD